MAEVILAWPETRLPVAPRIQYPWDQWCELDENGHGDIWLAEMGIDWPVEASSTRFRAILYNRAERMTRKRERDAPVRVMRVKGTNKVRKVKDFNVIRVKVKIVSDTQVAFQFFDTPEPPPEPEVIKVAVPKRRQPMRRRVAGTSVQKVAVGVSVS